MAFEKGHKHGVRFGQEVDPREAQRKAVDSRLLKKSRREAIMSIIKEQPLTADLAAVTDAMLLNATNAELQAIAMNEDMPTDVRRRARLLIGGDDELAMKTAETMRSRVFGKPAQAVVMSTTETPPPSIIEKTYEE